MASNNNPIYKTALSSNSSYVFFTVAAACVATWGYGQVVEGFWEANNAGKLFHHVNWDRFKEEEEEDDDDDDDDDE